MSENITETPVEPGTRTARVIDGRDHGGGR